MRCCKLHVHAEGPPLGHGHRRPQSCAHAGPPPCSHARAGCFLDPCLTPPYPCCPSACPAWLAQVYEASAGAHASPPGGCAYSKTRVCVRLQVHAQIAGYVKALPPLRAGGCVGSSDLGATPLRTHPGLPCLGLTPCRALFLAALLTHHCSSSINMLEELYTCSMHACVHVKPPTLSCEAPPVATRLRRSEGTNWHYVLLHDVVNATCIN